MSNEKRAVDLKNKAIYNGIDTRRDMHQIVAPTYSDAASIQKNAESVACIIKETQLMKINEKYELKANGKVTLSEYIQGEYNVSYGEKEPFGNQPVPGLGTAFLIAPQFVATAAHCVYNDDENARVDVKSFRFVFDFKLLGPEQYAGKFDKSQVYSGQTIVACEFGSLSVKNGTDPGDYIKGTSKN